MVTTLLLFQLVPCSLFNHVVTISDATFLIVVEFKNFKYQISSFEVVSTGGAWKGQPPHLTYLYLYMWL